MIKLYTQPSCGQCKMIHTLLDTKKIKYEEVSVTDLSQVEKLGIDHTPAAEIDGKIMYAKEIFNYINNIK